MDCAKIVYGLLCPDTHVCRYVGVAKSLHKRYGEHCRLSNNHQNTKRQSWLRSLLRDGKKPDLVILQEATPQHEQAEKNWIAYYRHYSRELLTNGSLGGADMRHANSSAASIHSKRERSFLSVFIGELGTSAVRERLRGNIGRADRLKGMHRHLTDLARLKRRDGTYQAWVTRLEQRYREKPHGTV